MTDFLTSVLPTQGVYCTVGIRAGVIKQSFPRTIDDVEATGEGLNAGGYDVYFALASFAPIDDELKRTAANAQYLRAFFLDIDCGMGKPYADQIEAAQALAAFVQDTGLPDPTIVNSGGGLHVYWPLTADIAVAEWTRYAKSLKRLCNDKGLFADPAITSDAARILRMPGTQNYKTDTPRPVQVMNSGLPTSFDAFIELLPAPPVDLSAAKAFGMDDATRDLGGEYPACSFARVAQRSLKDKGCAQVKNAILNAGTLEEPLWRAVLSIAIRCEDGDTAIHKVSKSHPEYTPHATEAKAAETKGPYTCEWYKTNYSAGCAGCSQKVSSPILLGKIVREAEVTETDEYVVEAPASDDTPAIELKIPAFPKPYFRGANGGVYRRDKDADGNVDEKMIYPDDLYITERFFDSDEHGTGGEGEMIGFHLHLRKDGVRRFYAPATAIFSRDKLRDLLTRNGVVAYGKTIDDLMAYFASSIRKLQHQFAANRTRNQMGWTPDTLGFVVGELEYTPNGTKLAPPASGTRALASSFRPTGTLEEWKQIANFYNRPGLEPHAFTMFMGFGAPLLKLVGGNDVKGFWVHLKNNGSGTGKSTAQMLANSVFGHPSELLMKKADTLNSKIHMLGMLNSMLLTLDEITNDAPEVISEMAYSITDGRGKHRMEGQSNKLRINHTVWQTMACTSANAGVIDKLLQMKDTADGELRRVLELSVAKYTGAPKSEIDAVFSKLQSNYGVAGPIFIEYVITHLDTVIDMIYRMQKKIDAEMGFDQSDRYYSVGLACIFTGGLIAQRLGLHDIEIAPVYKYITGEVESNKSMNRMATSTPYGMALEAIGSFVNKHINNVLVAPYQGDGEVPQRPVVMPKQDLKIRYDPETRELAIAASDLRDYLTSRQLDVKETMALLAKHNVVKNEGKSRPTRIGAGAVGNMKGIAVRCYLFDGDAIGIARDDFADD